MTIGNNQFTGYIKTNPPDIFKNRNSPKNNMVTIWGFTTGIIRYIFLLSNQDDTAIVYFQKLDEIHFQFSQMRSAILIEDI